MSKQFTAQFVDPKGIVLKDAGNFGLLAYGTTVPADATAGYQTGCIFYDTDAAAGLQLFINEGTTSSCDFNAVPSLAGSAAFTTRVTTTDGVSSGTARVVGGLAYSSVAASTAITGSTATEQLFDSNYTIPANTLKAGTVVKCRVQAIATGTTSTDTLAYKLYIGGSAGTALVSAAATDAANNDTFQAEFTLVCRTAGTTGTFVSTGSYKVTSAEGTYTIKDDITASTTINTTANQAVVVTGTWSVANATNTCRVDIMTVEIY